MHHLRRFLLSLLLFSQPVFSAGNTAIAWRSYSHNVFDEAKQQDRLVLLNLVAVWCHWCHVMDAKTYSTAGVQESIARQYIPVRVDHDADPTLAARYRDYGWPATVILKPDGSELDKRAGFITPQAMVHLLDTTYGQRRFDAPRGVSSSRTDASELSARWQRSLAARHDDSFDATYGGLTLNQKFLDADTVEFDLQLASAGDQQAAARVRKTLKGAARLVDPAFGGAYQYSVKGDWDHPHYEKIASVQADYLRVFSRAYRQFDDPVYHKVIEQVASYLIEFWQSPQGGYYNSQDADLVPGTKATGYFALPRERRLALGLPAIDKKRYASSNGLLIEGMLEAYLATGNEAYLDSAIKAFSWVMRHLLRDGGNFAHGEDARDSTFLVDNLYMARAMLAIYRVSGEKRWLVQAGKLAEYIGQVFSAADGGLNAGVDLGIPPGPQPEIDQNIQAARFLLELAMLEPPRAEYPVIENVMRFLVNPPIVDSRISDPGILIANAQWLRLKGDGTQQ